MHAFWESVLYIVKVSLTITGALKVWSPLRSIFIPIRELCIRSFIKDSVLLSVCTIRDLIIAVIAEGTKCYKRPTLFAVDDYLAPHLPTPSAGTTIMATPSLSLSLSSPCVEGTCSPTQASRWCGGGAKSYDSKTAWLSCSVDSNNSMFNICDSFSFYTERTTLQIQLIQRCKSRDLLLHTEERLDW